MTLSAYFHAQKITLFAALPADLPPILKPRLMERVPGAQTVIFAALPYYVEEDCSNLAMFARARDYHAFAAQLSAGAVALLRENHPGCNAEGFADHSPYAEGVGAAMAGIGVLGDNGLLITKKYSSYVFIWELVTSLTMESLAAEGIPFGDGEAKRCSHCGACAHQCPGGCIGSGRTTCLSAISQKKGDLSPEEKQLLKSAPYAWGCDVCQEACPYTAAARAANTLETEIPYFREKRMRRLTVEKVHAMPEEEYVSFAFGWRKKDVMLRNLTLRGGDR